jgi:hypothetical protein
MATAQAPSLVPAQPSVFRKRNDYTFTRHESWRDHDRVGGLGYMCAEDIDDAHKANRLDKDGNPMPLYRPRREHRIRHIEHTGVTGSTAMAHNIPDDGPKRDDGQRVKLSPTERLYLQAAVAKRYMRAIRLVASLLPKHSSTFVPTRWPKSCISTTRILPITYSRCIPS